MEVKNRKLSSITAYGKNAKKHDKTQINNVAESIKQYGQALLDIPCYKILMGTDGKNLKETADLYDLTEAEQELLLARKRGHALFMAGAKRLHIQFDIPEYKFNYMGKGGGR